MSCLPRPTRPAPAVVGRVAAEPDLMGELDDMYRRELLRLLSVAGALVTLPPAVADAAEHDFADPADYAALNAHLWQVFALSKSKRLVYPLVHDQLGQLVDRMDQARTSAEHHQLCVLACDLFQLAGEIFFDGNRYTDAAHCYSLAASAGRETRSHDRWACALTRQAFVNMYDKQYTQAAAILSAAARVARHGDSELSTRHWVAAVQAQAYAGLGDREACSRALDTADGVTDLTGTAQPGGWLRFDGSRLAEERGTCYLTLGQADLAEAALHQALDGAISPRRHGSILTDLAALGIQRHDLDQVIRYASDAVDLAEQTQSSGYIGRKLQALQTQLGPLLPSAKIARLDDRITQLSITG